jgi:hypothetical protein
MAEFAYTQQTRDLSNLVRKRVSAAVQSVLQLSDDPDEQYYITLSGAIIAAGMWTGVADVRAGNDTLTDLPTALRLLADEFERQGRR